MPYPRRYVDPVTTSIRLERDEKKVAEKLDIELSTALKLGLHFMIEDRLLASEKPVLELALLEAYKRLREKDVKEIIGYLKSQARGDEAYKKLREEARVQRAAEDEKVLVWNDSTERRETIRAGDFDPSLHRRIIKQEEVEA